MRNGQLFERPTLVPPTAGKDSSSLRFDTPDTMPEAPNSGSNRKTQPAGLLNQIATLLPTPAANDSGNTPENHLRKKPGRTQVTSLQIIAEYGLIETGGRLLPTPQAHDAQGGKTPEQVATMRAKGHGVANLNEVPFHLLPTPAVNDMGAGKTPEQWDELTAKWKASSGNGNGHGKSLEQEAIRHGAVTAPPSTNGSKPSDDQHPTQPPPGEPDGLF